MQRRPRSIGAVLVAPLVMVVVACSGGEAPAPTTSPTAPSSTSSTTTTPSESAPPATPTTPPTPPPSTTAPTVTVEPTTVPIGSTLPPTTPVVPVSTLAGNDDYTSDEVTAIEQAWSEALRLYDVALADPTDEAARDAALARFTAGSRDAVESTYDVYLSRNYRRVDDPLTDHDRRREQGPSPVAGTDLAAVRICEVGTWTLVETDPASGETLNVVSDTTAAIRFDVRLRLVDGSWKVAEQVTVDQWVGAGACAPLG